MNILDLVADVLREPNLKKGFFPAQPDDLAAVFEYPADPPEHHFGGTDIIHGIQFRVRSLDAQRAYGEAKRLAEKLNRYNDGAVSILQSTAILDIGRDDSNPSRQEYTVNFTVRRH